MYLLSKQLWRLPSRHNCIIISYCFVLLPQLTQLVTRCGSAVVDVPRYGPRSVTGGVASLFLDQNVSLNACPSRWSSLIFVVTCVVFANSDCFVHCRHFAHRPIFFISIPPRGLRKICVVFL